MPKQTINTLQVYEQKSWAGLTTDNHLGSVFNEEPTLVSSIMSRVFGMYSYTGMDTLISMLGGDEELPTDADFEWYLKGDDEKAIPVSGNLGDGGATPGLNHTTLRIKFKEKWGAQSHPFYIFEKDLIPIRATIWTWCWKIANSRIGTYLIRLLRS